MFLPLLFLRYIDLFQEPGSPPISHSSTSIESNFSTATVQEALLVHHLVFELFHSSFF